MSSEKTEMAFEQLKFEIDSCHDAESRAFSIRKAVECGVQLSKIDSLLDLMELQEQTSNVADRKKSEEASELNGPPNTGPIPGTS